MKPKSDIEFLDKLVNIIDRYRIELAQESPVGNHVRNEIIEYIAINGNQFDVNHQPIDELPVNKNPRCRCGHLHSEHKRIQDHNYTAGMCAIGECRCKFFVTESKEIKIMNYLRVQKHVPKWLQNELYKMTEPHMDILIAAHKEHNLGWNRFSLQSLALEMAALGYFHAVPNPPEEKPID